MKIKVLISLFAIYLLSGCQLLPENARLQVYRVAVQQGNVVDIENIKKLEVGMTEEQAAAAAGVNAEDMKRMDIQEKIQKLIGKIQQAFAPVLEVVVDIVDALAPAIQVIGGIVGGITKFLNKIGVLKPLVISVAAVLASKSIAIGTRVSKGGS